MSECDMPWWTLSNVVEISAANWKDLTFFARATPSTNEPYHVALMSALDQHASPVELRSVSKCRLAWRDVEFRRDDVTEVWSLSYPAKPNEVRCGPRTEAAGEATGGTRLSTRRNAPLSNRDLHRWYQERIAELAARDES
jgi:hypothetical protein